MDGWKTIVSFWDGRFSGAKMLVLGRVTVWNAWLLIEVDWKITSAQHETWKSTPTDPPMEAQVGLLLYLRTMEKHGALLVKGMESIYYQMCYSLVIIQLHSVFFSFFSLNWEKLCNIHLSPCFSCFFLGSREANRCLAGGGPVSRHVEAELRSHERIHRGDLTGEVRWIHQAATHISERSFRSCCWREIRCM